MPEVTVEIGGRKFDVACQEGEEEYLHMAAGMLDEEAGALSGALGRLPEARMLLMAGLMLADRTVGLQSKAQKLEEALEAARGERDALQRQLDAAAAGTPAGVAPETLAALDTLTARAERLAETLEDVD